MEKKYHWGIDLGGTKIECAILDQHDPTQVILRERIDTESIKGYDHIVAQVGRLIDSVSQKVGFRPIRLGFSTPGVLDPASLTMKNSNTTCMNGQPMDIDLAKVVGCEVVLANDANCFALAEALLGAVPDINKDAQVVFGVILGTGVGGGLVVNGKVIKGLHGIGGEWGHNIVEEGGEPCYCGKAGCVEKVIAGPSLELFYERQSGVKKKLTDIVQAYHAGSDSNATATMERLFEYYGKAISTLINVIDPDVIVIGGGVGNIDLLYTEGYERIKKYIFNSGEVLTPIVKPKLGDSAGVFGAAML